jgi:hypothetical protein
MLHLFLLDFYNMILKLKQIMYSVRVSPPPEWKVMDARLVHKVRMLRVRPKRS